MLEGGEDPRFIARRMIILASEDIGNADPQALQVAVAAAHAVEHVGMPEGAFALAQAAIYLSLAPKSDGVGRAARRGARARPRARRGRAAAVDPAPLELLRLPARPPRSPRARRPVARGARGQRFYRPDDAEGPLAAWYERIQAARGGAR